MFTEAFRNVDLGVVFDQANCQLWSFSSKGVDHRLGSWFHGARRSAARSRHPAATGD